MNTVLKRIVSFVIVIVLTLGMFLYLNRVFVLKRVDGITTMQDFYAQDVDTVDVLLLGSSHCGMNLDTAALWEEYGIASYALWGSAQPFWNSYYFMLEALKTQHPQVVVLETYAAKLDVEYSDYARTITNTAGMKFNLNRWNACMASTAPGKALDLFLGIPNYHQRYTEITQSDFTHFPWTEHLNEDKGSGVRFGTGDFKLVDVSEVTEVKQILPKEEEYLRKIIEHCKNLNLPLLLITTPTGYREAEQPYCNAVAQIAEEYDLEYINYNLMDAQTGFTQADYWTDGHVNTEGARKISSHLGGVLRESYGVSDRRGDEKWDSWNVNWEVQKDTYLKKITSGDAYIRELAGTRYSYLIVKNSSWDPNEKYEKALDAIEEMTGQSDLIRKSGGGAWFAENTQPGSLENVYFGDLYCKFEVDGRTLSVDWKSGTGISLDGRKLVNLGGTGLLILVYDREAGEVFEIVAMHKADGFTLKHVYAPK